MQTDLASKADVLKLRGNGRNNSQQCWELLANDVASVFTGSVATSTATETPYLKSKRYYSAFSNFIALILDMLAVFLELNSKRMHLSSEK